MPNRGKGRFVEATILVGAVAFLVGADTWSRRRRPGPERGRGPGACATLSGLPTWPACADAYPRVSESKDLFHSHPGPQKQMKQVYRVLAYLVAAGVAVQAASISYGMFGLIKWIEGGGTLDQSTELTPALGGWLDFRGMPRLAFSSSPSFRCCFSSFFAKVPGGIRWALIVLGVTCPGGAGSLLPFGCRTGVVARHHRPRALRDRNDGRHAHQPGGGQQG